MRTLLVAGLLSLSPLVNASPFFESIIDSLAIKTTASHTNNDWEAADKIQGVKWEWPYYESGVHDSTMQGTTHLGKNTNPNIGATTVTINGARTFITDISVSIANEGADIHDFGTGKITQLKTSCDDDSATYQVAFYQFEEPNYKPLYISQTASWGASGSGSVDFKLAYEVNDLLATDPVACELLE